MAKGDVTGVSFADIKKLVRSEGDAALLEKAEKVLGATLVIAGAATGTTVPLSLLGAKNELANSGRAVVKRLTRNREDGFYAKSRRLAAAHALVGYVAFFEALDEITRDLGDDLRLSDDEKVAFVGRAEAAPQTSTATETLLVRATALPHPVGGAGDVRASLLSLYQQLTQNVQRFMAGLRVVEEANEQLAGRLAERLEGLPETALQAYDGLYVELSATFPEFRAWAAHEDSRRLAGVDIGLTRLAEAIEQAPHRQASSEALRLASALRRTYEANIRQRIIEDQLEVGPDTAALSFPTKADAFVPQRFRVIRTTDATDRVLEHDRAWSSAEPRDDLSDFLLDYFESPYSAETPLIVLGHPGSGKSLLTQVLAARLATPEYNPVRIELRDVDADRDLQTQIEDQVRSDTGIQTDWLRLTEELAGAPPLIILDGLDELLQASGRVHANFLEGVRQFQARELVQERPVRAVVTSRISLIDKARIPTGSTVIRLEEFDEERRRMWIEVWNDHNRDYFNDSGTRPFCLPDSRPIAELSRQPLLLLMLALYDSESNALHVSGELDRTLLYDRLLRRFIERERMKGASKDEYLALAPPDKHAAIGADMARLGVAAMSMFNRRSLLIRTDELDRDIGYFGLARSVVDDAGRRLSQSELLLGSFFFVHESRSRDADEGQSAFEFLHNTFGEFLTADFILKQIIDEISALQALASDPALQRAYDRQLTDGPPSNWYTALMYTPLHTRPVVVQMLREWARHRTPSDDAQRKGFIEQFEAVITSQLQLSLTGTGAPGAMRTETPRPYGELPLIGHLATYTLNLVVLLACVVDEEYVLQEDRISGPRTVTRPWDQLSYLWRSWLGFDGLAGITSVVRCERDEDGIHIAGPRPAYLANRRDRLASIVQTATAIGDDITTGLAGLHLYDVTWSPPRMLRDIAARLSREHIDLDLPILLREAEHQGRHGSKRPLAELAEYAERSLMSGGRSRAEVQLFDWLSHDDTPIFARAVASSRLDQPRPREFLDVPSAIARSRIRFVAGFEPLWADDVIRLMREPGLLSGLFARRPETLAEVLRLASAAAGVGAETRFPAGELERLLHEEKVRSPGLAAEIAIYGDAIGQESVYAAATSALVGFRPTAVAYAATPDVLRRLILIAERRGHDPLRQWLASFTRHPRALEALAPDVALDVARIAGEYDLRGKEGRVDLRRELRAWPDTRSDEHLGAVLRFVESRPETLGGLLDDRRHSPSIDRTLLFALGLSERTTNRLPQSARQQLDRLAGHLSR
jgi:hypothetical protein